ncbi:hypothetical protein D3C86_1712240 [compost metagenome]
MATVNVRVEAGVFVATAAVPIFPVLPLATIPNFIVSKFAILFSLSMESLPLVSLRIGPTIIFRLLSFTEVISAKIKPFTCLPISSSRFAVVFMSEMVTGLRVSAKIGMSK